MAEASPFLNSVLFKWIIILCGSSEVPRCLNVRDISPPPMIECSDANGGENAKGFSRLGWASYRYGASRKIEWECGQDMNANVKGQMFEWKDEMG